ncbi:unnamed protein product [Bursaphelenchus xylophilus]|uniref:(pine wood nematode) hypothetical protein n=1 Tax=Bursaphelenchus xylophilus TaxID=6326 RepID=A0A7I8X836_BURXY|nr:unnamed protein product [Bursaphelenchus xylophilus]CAG9126134.1 unnamed protein product [Bursaphelenchus xylophilus]
MQLHRNDLEKYVQLYLFPCLIVFGILGNALNLTVLLNKRMRSRANTFLSLLAISDIAFLVFLTPHVLATFHFLYVNYYFRWFYFHTKIHWLALANWMSAVAIWVVIAVCADRLIGIRKPLYIRSHVASYKMMLILALIVVAPFLLTLFRHFEHYCPVNNLCYDTQVYSKCFPITHDVWQSHMFQNTFSYAYRKFIRMSILTNTVFIVMCPIILLATLNILLLCALRQRSSEMSLIQDDITTKPCVNNQKHHKTEQRVTLTVTLIVTLFTFTNGPSGVVSFFDLVSDTNAKPTWWYNAGVFANSLVVVGKASNFIIFCLFSKHFRKRLFGLAQKKVHEKMESRRRSSIHKTSGLSRRDTSSRKPSSQPMLF